MTPIVLVIIIAVFLFLIAASFTVWNTMELGEPIQFMLLVFELMLFVLICGFFIDSTFMRKNSLDYWKKQVIKYERLAEESKDADDKRYYLEVKAENAKIKYKAPTTIIAGVIWIFSLLKILDTFTFNVTITKIEYASKDNNE